MTEMQDIDHTNPETGETFGAVFQRGPVVADGGRDTETEAEERTDGGQSQAETEADKTEQVMADVDHETDGTESTNRVYERGTEGREDRV